MAGSEIYKLSERMEKMTKRELQKFKSAHGLHGLVLPSSGPSKTQAPARSSKRSAAQKNTEKDDDGNTNMQSASGVVEYQDESNEVTRDMKLEFVAKIKKLSNQGLTSLVHKIKEVKANSITDLPEEKIQIRVDDFDKTEFT